MTEQKTELLSSKIMIIDDDVSIGMMLEEVLRDHGYTLVRYISDPCEAENIFKEFQPDLIMLDVKMPKMDGFEVMEALAPYRKKSFIPILMLTAEAEESICIRAKHQNGHRRICGCVYSSWDESRRS